MIAAPLLAVDIGGTNTKIRLVSSTDSASSIEVERPVANRSDMLNVLRETLNDNAATPPVYCVVSAAGPVEGGERVRMTNWKNERVVSLSDLALAGVDTKRATMVNDMVVSSLGIVAHNVESRGPDNWARRLSGSGETPVGGNMVVIMPGTGLGVAGVVHVGSNPAAVYRVVPCELQHAPIGALNDLQQQVRERMRNRLGIERPSWEHFVCGHGLVRVHQMLNNADEPMLSAADIARRGIAGTDSSCRQAMDLFYLCAGGIAQLTALCFLPTSGIYLSGRSSRDNASFIVKSQFVRELQNNVTHGDLLKKFDVYLVTQDTNLDGGIFLARHRLARL